MKLQTRQIMVTVVAIAGFLSLGGCVGRPKEQTKPINNIASSSTKEAIKKKQLAYLKEHEQEMTAYVKAHNANITQVTYDWDSIKTVVGGNGTPQGGDEILLVYGYANGSDLTNFSLNFTLDENKMPKIDSIGSDNLYRV